jgi:hypothetical protein
MTNFQDQPTDPSGTPSQSESLRISLAEQTRQLMDELHAEALAEDSAAPLPAPLPGSFDVMAEIGRLQARLTEVHLIENAVQEAFLAARFVMHAATDERRKVQAEIDRLAREASSRPLSAPQTDEQAPVRGTGTLGAQNGPQGVYPFYWAPGKAFRWRSPRLGTERTGHLVRKSGDYWAVDLDLLDSSGSFRTTLREDQLLSALD